MCGVFIHPFHYFISRYIMEEKHHKIISALDQRGHLPEGAIWRPKWFLVMRVFAVIGVVGALILARSVFHIEKIDYVALWILTFVLFVSNGFYFVYYKWRKLDSLDDSAVLLKRLSRFTKTQITIDLIILTLMLHYSGGATNPFVLYFFFHMILASILLSKRAAYVEATVAAVLFSTMTLLEGYKVIHHYQIYNSHNYTMPTFIMGMIFSLTSALYIAVYMATSIMDRLHLHRTQLKQAYEEQLRLEEEKSRFLEIVAHDLRSPLAAIDAMVSALLAVYKDQMNPEMKNILERIPHRTHDLIKFTSDLLDFSQIRSIRQITTNYKPLNFLPIVTTTVEMYMNEAQEKNITVTVHSDPTIPLIIGSRDHLERMVANLISNALRYTPQQGSMTVKLTAENDEVVLIVADTGIGIPEKDLPNIFNEFYRAENAKQFTPSGTGLGMSIVKTVVEQHSGKVSIQSQVGEGTAVTVRLPAVQNTITSKQ